MAEYVAIDIERLKTPYKLETEALVAGTSSSSQGSRLPAVQSQGDQTAISMQRQDTNISQKAALEQDSDIECRICQEEDSAANFEVPCSCSGSLKFAHRKCLQRWCNEKGDTTCEICLKPFESGYTAPAQSSRALPLELRGDWGITGDHQFDLHDPHILAMAAERHFFQDYDDYAAANASYGACCRSITLILMALLLLRHALAIGSAGEDDDFSTFLMLFLLRAASFLLPCYIMARAMNIMQRRRQRQEWASRGLNLIDAVSTSYRLPLVNLLSSR